MTVPLSELTVRGLLVKKLRESKALGEDIAHFDRFDSDKPGDKHNIPLEMCHPRHEH
mgnify:CR=1 FL=1